MPGFRMQDKVLARHKYERGTTLATNSIVTKCRGNKKCAAAINCEFSTAAAVFLLARHKIRDTASRIAEVQTTAQISHVFELPSVCLAILLPSDCRELAADVPTQCRRHLRSPARHLERPRGIELLVNLPRYF